MRIFLLLLFTAGTLSAQSISRNEAISRINAATASLTATIKPLQFGSIPLSNFVSFLTANGITNIAGGSNAVLSVINGTLVISGTGFATNNIRVLQGTNLQFEIADFDFFNVGVLIPTNTVYIASTNTTTGNGTNFVADFNYSEQIITVTNAVNFLHGTNLWMGPTNAYLTIALLNFSGANQTLAIPAAWKESLNFPTLITNGTILELKLKNYGGLSPSNILAGATQF